MKKIGEKKNRTNQIKNKITRQKIIKEYEHIKKSDKKKERKYEEKKGLIKKKIKKEKEKKKLKKKKNPRTLYNDIYTYSEHVKELKGNKDFEYKVINNEEEKRIKVINKLFNKKGFILFYAPWCKHCLKIDKTYDELASYYSPHYPFGSVNIEDVKNKNDILRIRAKVVKYPTLFKVTTKNTLKKIEMESDPSKLLEIINQEIIKNKIY
jgi:thiol-disulfide isomerase/thioredoxin